MVPRRAKYPVACLGLPARGIHGIRNGAEQGVQRVAHGGQGANGGHGNERGNEAILDGSGTGVVVIEGLEHILHGWFPL